MPVCRSVMFSFCGRSLARVSYPRAPARNNISKYSDRWQLPCCAVRCRTARGSPAVAKTGTAGAGPNGRIQQPGSRLRTWAALTRSRWMAPSSAIAALQTSGLRPTEPALVHGSFRLAERKATSGARNPLPDWQAPYSAAPAADNIRRTWLTRCFWPTTRILSPEHDNAAPPLCDQPWPACRE